MGFVHKCSISPHVSAIAIKRDEAGAFHVTGSKEANK